MPEYMKAAEMKYDENGKPVWDEMWNAFCNLAAEGGPSHRDSAHRINFPTSAEFIPNENIKNEIIRGLKMLNADITEVNDKGEILINLKLSNKAKWFSQIINTENVAAKHTGGCLVLPWNGNFQIDKEIKSLMTVWGKASHYWNTHRPIQIKIFILIFGYDPMLSL